MVERGLKNEEIARRLGISPTTAKYHVSQILMKLDVANRREAGAWRLRRMPALLSVLKGGAFLAGTAAVAAVIYFGLIGLLLADSRAGATEMGKVAYIAEGDVWVKELPDGPETQLTKWGDVVGHINWSASGEWLSVRRNLPASNERASSGWSTWIIGADGKRERQLDVHVIGRWSPVKDEILVNGTSSTGDGSALFVENADGSNRRLVIGSSTTRAGIGLVDWTPSGEWIIGRAVYLTDDIPVVSPFDPDSPPIQSLFRVRSDGTDERPFYHVKMSEGSKNAQRTQTPYNGPYEAVDEIIYGSTLAAREQIREWVQEYVTFTESEMIGTFVTLDSATNPILPNPVQAVPLDGSTGTVWGGNVAYWLPGHEEPTFAHSPVSNRIAVVVGPEDALGSPINKRIALYDPASGRSQYLTELGEAAVHPSWSADGGTLFFAAADGSTDAPAASADPISSHRIWSMAADGTNRTQLTNDPRYRDEFPRMTAEGNLLFTRIDLETEGNIASIWLLDLTTGSLEPVVEGLEGRTVGGSSSLEGPNVLWQWILDWWQPK